MAWSSLFKMFHASPSPFLCSTPLSIFLCFPRFAFEASSSLSSYQGSRTINPPSKPEQERPFLFHLKSWWGCKMIQWLLVSFPFRISPFFFFFFLLKLRIDLFCDFFQILLKWKSEMKFCFFFFGNHIRWLMMIDYDHLLWKFIFDKN